MFNIWRSGTDLRNKKMFTSCQKLESLLHEFVFCDLFEIGKFAS
jgi:hypothetical protein